MNRGNALGPALAGVLTALAVVVPIALVAAVGTMPNSVDVSWLTIPKATKTNVESAVTAEATPTQRLVKATPEQTPPTPKVEAPAVVETKKLEPKPQAPTPEEPKPVPAERPEANNSGPVFAEATPSEFPTAPGPESPHLLDEKPAAPAKEKSALEGLTLALSNVLNSPKETKTTPIPTPAPKVDTVPVAPAVNAPVWTNTFDYAQIWTGDPSKKMVALTIDDGPHPTFTPKILATLKAEGVTASFFFIGRNVECCPDIARQAAAEGHDILNHTFNHIRLGDQPESVVRRELSEGMRAIEEATGFAPRVYRTPGGGYSTTVLRVANEMGMTMAQWSANAYDGTRGNGSNPTADDVYRAVMQQVRNGGIVLMHEPSAGTLEALPRIIRDLKARGYQFVPLTTMLQQQRGEHTSFEAAMARGAFSPKDYVLR